MTIDPEFIALLETIVAVRLDEPLSRHTTIGIGGPADAYMVVENALQLSAVVQLCLTEGVPYFVLGSGSNIVIGDLGIRGVTIQNNATRISDPRLLDSDSFQAPSEWALPETRTYDANDEPPTPSGEASAPQTGVAGKAASSEVQTNDPPTKLRTSVRSTTPPPRYRVRAESGAGFAVVSRHLSFAGYAGLEWACGIPGTIGGAVVFNAGAYGGCLGDVLERICVADINGEHVIEAADLGLVYRGSAFTHGLMAGRVVLWAEFILTRADPAELRARIEDYDARRLKAQPRGRNAGSFFKNPPEQPAWKLIEAVGLRGYQVGGAQFSEKHCNFLINTGEATAADVAALKRLAQQRIQAEFNIHLDNEVRLIGEGWGDEK